MSMYRVENVTKFSKSWCKIFRFFLWVVEEMFKGGKVPSIPLVSTPMPASATSLITLITVLYKLIMFYSTVVALRGRRASYLQMLSLY